MGVTKVNIYSEEQVQIAALSKAVGHPARVAIIQQLLLKGSCICGSLVDEIGLAQPTISQHLRELKKVGLIKGTIEGTSVCYCLDQEKCNEIFSVFRELFDVKITGPNSCC